MQNYLVTLFILMAITFSDNRTKNESLEKEAEAYMKGAMVEANNWLKEFNHSGYALFLDHKFPAPFDKIIFESMDSINKQEGAQKWINQVEQEYGKVKERALIGIHIILKGKLLTHLANGTPGFMETSPRRLGLRDINQMYIKNIEGTYAYLMYESKPTKKDRAEELLVLWLDKNNKWRFLTYKIADDI